MTTKDEKDFRDRVIAEKKELDEKAIKLSNFIGISDGFNKLDTKCKELLREQNDIMWQYSEILGLRIAEF